ncbi:MAG: hypothetical protein KA201_05120, partial [Kofleriaceae bacterium]|nr:hypothetical protein [Kofleriaceae bacterium]
GAVKARALLLLMVACGGGSKPPTTAPPAQPAPEPTPTVDEAGAAEVADAFVEVLATMVQISQGDDCKAMGTSLGQLFDRSQPLFDQALTLAHDPASSKLLVAAMNARSAEVDPLVEAMGPGLVRCKDEPSVVDAMERMPTLNL